jgi:hypothetical protein
MILKAVEASDAASNRWNKAKSVQIAAFKKNPGEEFL